MNLIAFLCHSKMEVLIKIFGDKKILFKIILNEIRHFFYSQICTNLIRNKTYINLFVNNDWVVNNKMKESVYIQIILDNLKDINDKLNMFLFISLKGIIRFVYIFLNVMINKIKDNFEKMKEINHQRINVMIVDLKTLQNKIYEIINNNENNNGNKNNNKL